MKPLKLLFLALVGGLAYYWLEHLWRGYSHWTMFVLGGACFVACGLINEALSWETPLPLQMLLGGAIITILELAMGCVVNLWLHWNVWDYSLQPLNFLGQICAKSSLLWCGLSLVAILLDDYIRYWLFGEERPHYILWRRRNAA